jgi:hypothetical protein
MIIFVEITCFVYNNDKKKKGKKCMKMIGCVLDLQNQDLDSISN